MDRLFERRTVNRRQFVQQELVSAPEIERAVHDLVASREWRPGRTASQTTFTILAQILQIVAQLKWLVDGYLARGWLTREQARFSFQWGVRRVDNSVVLNATLPG